MSGWRDRLQKGSFRGIAFHTDNASGSAGRRVAVHEYPQQEKYYAEDLGKKAESERLKVFVIGADYDLARDELMAALNKPGTGKLVHPYLGTLQIQVQDFDWTISTRQGGYCEFNIQYVRAGKITPPTSSNNTGKALQDNTATSENAAKDGFINRYSVDDTAAFVEESALEKMNDLVSSIRAINGQIAGALQPISTVAAIIDDFGNEVATLVSQPSKLVNAVFAVAASAFGAVDDIKVAFKGYDHLLAGFAENLVADVTGLSVNRTQEAQNSAALNVLIVSAATISATNAIVNIQSAASGSSSSTSSAFVTLTDAQTARDTLLTTIDTLIDSGISDDEYYAWADVQSTLVKYTSELEPNLATSNTVQLTASLPALVVAYNLYGDADREEELTTRNAIANPLFIPAGVDLEVLS